ncbi:MAG: orotate phosphoribosyltransferase [Wenzhouxiangellaceae bacterium]|nr:orotate phosphoribosyltransferase [Wenzhouxiangellaceae bacterium]
MQDWTDRFIDLAREAGALQFGHFELKSGRVSPYFFNAGRFDEGRTIAGVADCYADAIVASGVEFDLLFGPAYKGIPLATAVAVSLYRRHERSVPVAWNRKEAKDHGEGGQLVGAAVDGRVLVVDDVISAGTAFGQARAIIERAGGRVVGLAVGLDRQERGSDRQSARAEIVAAGVDVISVAALDDLITQLERDDSNTGFLSDMLEYRLLFGA